VSKIKNSLIANKHFGKEKNTSDQQRGIDPYDASLC